MADCGLISQPMESTAVTGAITQSDNSVNAFTITDRAVNREMSGGGMDELGSAGAGFGAPLHTKLLAKRILIIDANPHDRALYKHFLKTALDESYEILEAQSGREGLLLCRTHYPHCV